MKSFIANKTIETIHISKWPGYVPQCSIKENKAVYTTAPVAGGWAGAVMIWAGAVMIWAGACSNTKFPTLKTPKKAKKQSVTDRRTDGPTNTETYRSRCPRQKYLMRAINKWLDHKPPCCTCQSFERVGPFLPIWNILHWMNFNAIMSGIPVLQCR